MSFEIGRKYIAYNMKGGERFSVIAVASTKATVTFEFTERGRNYIYGIFNQEDQKPIRFRVKGGEAVANITASGGKRMRLVAYED